MDHWSNLGKQFLSCLAKQTPDDWVLIQKAERPKTPPQLLQSNHPLELNGQWNSWQPSGSQPFHSLTSSYFASFPPNELHECNTFPTRNKHTNTRRYINTNYPTQYTRQNSEGRWFLGYKVRIIETIFSPLFHLREKKAKLECMGKLDDYSNDEIRDTDVLRVDVVLENEEGNSESVGKGLCPKVLHWHDQTGFYSYSAPNHSITMEFSQDVQFETDNTRLSNSQI